MKPKDIVKSFYDSNFYKDQEVLKSFIHPECELYWSSSGGFVKFNYSDIIVHGERIASSFKELRPEISHVIAEDNFVTIRYTYYAVTYDHPEDEICLAHFISIWEVKDDKLYRCHEMSQMADENAVDNNAYLSIKVS
jgi:hypothetical protein|tara:strand:- start:1059 stop:1469 length:411 start_codon:yes stop_codon:yes gene_type:complete